MRWKKILIIIAIATILALNFTIVGVVAANSQRYDVVSISVGIVVVCLASILSVWMIVLLIRRLRALSRK